MSDGPHKSLPMKRAWKSVAERADNPAFSVEEVSAALVPALEQDFRDEISPAFVRDVLCALEDRESGLFKTDPLWLSGLQRTADSGLERAILENVGQIPPTDVAALDVLLDAVGGVLLDRAARCARQMEEHYLRLSTAPRAAELRARIDDAIGSASMGTIAAGVVNPKDAESPRSHSKKRGLDDGVTLP